MNRLIAGCAITLMTSTALFAGSPSGVWLSSDGGAKVRITDCHGALCGNIVWLKRPTDPATGRPRTDKLNPDANKRDRAMLGLPVVQGLEPMGPNKWAGRIYNADEGHFYKVSLSLDSSTRATLKGCVLGVICKNEIWTRVE